MKKIFLSIISTITLFAVQSCDNGFDNDVTSIAVTSGEANFSKYVALGNSLTSGYRDNALYSDGQNESYPSMIAKQMQLAGGGEFKQPLMADNLGGIPQVGFGNKLVLASVNGSLSPVVATGSATTTLASIYSAGPYQNMGVPAAKSFHLIAPGYGSAANLATNTANPYFVRFASSPTTTVLADAMAQNPTFFSLWIGNNDVLGYATSGGDGSNPITSEALFTQAYTVLTTTLTSKGAKGVVANIPNVTSVPLFTTVPKLPIANLSSTDVAALMSAQAYGKYNAGLAQAKAAGLLSDAEYQKRLINFTAGSTGQGAVIVDKDLTNLSALGIPSYRQTTTNDYILLTASSLMKPYDATTNPSGISAGTKVPLADKYVLTEKEAKTVLDATAKFNTIIKSAADAKGLAFVDANSKMTELSGVSGVQWDGVKYTTKFVTGGAFSLDGVHLTGRGYGIIANEFIKAINAKYKSNLPLVNANAYSGVKFP